MGFFNEEHEDALGVSAETATRGKRVGFLEAFDISFQTQVRTAAMFGIQEAMRNLDDEQRQAMRKAGIEDAPSLSSKADDPMRMFTDMGNDYLDVARFMQEGGTPEMGQRITEYDDKINSIRKRYPELNVQSASEMWQTVRTRAQELEKTSSFMRGDNFMAPVGSFLGGLAGSMNPNTDPLNVATLPVGGFGKSVVGRIATQGGAQAGIETVNQVLGVQEQRQLLGLSNGPIDAATRVGGAFIGGAAIQGTGEVIGIGIRKLWPSRPIDQVPPQMLTIEGPKPLPVDAPEVRQPGIPENVEVAGAKLTEFPESFNDYVHLVSPTSTTRIGKMRTATDMAHVEERLSAWDGPPPWQVEPKMDTAQIKAQNDFVAMPAMKDIVRDGNIDRLARRVDPDAMSRFDELANEKKTERLRLQAATADRDAAATVNTELDKITDQLAALDHKIANVGAMKAKKLRKQRDELVINQRNAVERLAQAETPEMSIIRQRIVAIDEKMRDLAEPVSRAYARARGKWAATEAEHNDVIAMIREGRTESRAQPEDVSDFLPRARTIEEQIPALTRRSEVDVKQDADAADVLMAVIAKDVETMAEAIEQSRAEIKKLLTPVEVKETVDLGDEYLQKHVSVPGSERYTSARSPSSEIVGDINGNEVVRDFGALYVFDSVKKEYGSMQGRIVAVLKTEVKEGSRRVSHIVVTPALQRKGVATALLSKAHSIWPEIKMDTSADGEFSKAGAALFNSYNSTLRLPGHETPLHLDNDHVIGEAGDKMTVREFLQRQLDDEEDLMAVTSCSIL